MRLQNDLLKAYPWKINTIRKLIPKLQSNITIINNFFKRPNQFFSFSYPMFTLEHGFSERKVFSMPEE